LPRSYVNPQLTFKAFQYALKLAPTNYPELFKGWQRFEADHRFYNCNLFVFPKAVYFDYCEQMFASLFAAREYLAAKNLQVMTRFSGIAAEYLTSFYQSELVAQNRYASRELPVVFLDPPNATKV
jgi:hypothetical protein